MSVFNNGIVCMFLKLVYDGIKTYTLPISFKNKYSVVRTRNTDQCTVTTNVPYRVICVPCVNVSQIKYYGFGEAESFLLMGF